MCIWAISRFWPKRLHRGPRKDGRDRAYKRFVHQELAGYSPIMTGNRVLAFFLVAAVILIPLGAAILAASLSVVEYKVRYDNVGVLNSSSKQQQQQTLLAAPDNTGITQTVSITTSKNMNAPVCALTPASCTAPSTVRHAPSSICFADMISLTLHAVQNVLFCAGLSIL